MELIDLKLQAFEIRRKIDEMDFQKAQLVKQYNEIYLKINQLELNERKVNSDNGKIGNKITAHK